jgi:hypothetical protein
MHRVRLAAFALAGCLWPAAAGAQGLVRRLPGLGPTAFTFTNTNLVRFRGNNFDANPRDDNFGSYTLRLDMAATAAPWRLYARVDGFSPIGHDTGCGPEEASLCYLRSNYRPERLSLRYQRGAVTFELGDFYQVFGRGVTLAFRKVDPIGLDTTLRGGRFEYERERLTVRGFAGLGNPQNLDPISLSIFPDPEDFLTGASVATRVGADADIELSGHVVHADFERGADNARQDSIDIAGWRAEFPSLLDGALTLYGEANVMRRQIRQGERISTCDGLTAFAGRGLGLDVGDGACDAGPSATRNGRAVYAAAQLQRGRFTILAEWKDYTNYLLGPTENANSSPRDVARVYSTAPSLERDDQRIFTNANARGGRVRIDYTRPQSPWIFTFNTVAYGWAEASNARGEALDPWDDREGMLTSHTYFAIRRRSRPVIAPQRPAADPSGAAAASGGATSTASAGGANITAGGLSGASVTRVARGDFNLIASVGYRREFRLGTADAAPGRPPSFEAGDVKHESMQMDIDYAFPVGSNDSIELRLDHRFERNFLFDRLTGFDFSQLLGGVRGGLMVSWSHGLPLVVSVTMRWDNTSRAPEENGLFFRPFGASAAANGGAPLLPTLYPSAEVRWNFTISNFLRVFAGMTPGGRVCSGGVCRDVPLFQGAIAELVFRI